MKKKIVLANDARYVSQIPEFKNELPKGILNKRKADVGGTFAVLNYPTNYIIVVPSLSLIDSIKNDKNVPYEVFDVKGGTNLEDFYRYIRMTTKHKIVVTYDSFQKLLRWLERKKISPNSFKVLIDEFHLILENFGFKKNAIDGLLKSVQKFEHVTFMSATPIDDDFIFSVIKNLPYTVVDWGKETKINIKRFETNNTTKVVVRLIEKFLSNNGITITQINSTPTKIKELYIFANTVKDIAVIIKTLKLSPDIVKVVCSKKIKNETILKNVNIDISDVSDPNKKINFFTSRAFQGCNLFSNNGLIIAVSDSSKKHTLIDVQTSLYQIHGRLRTNDEFQNVFRHLIVHIYSTGYSRISDEEFNNEIEDKTKNSYNLISIYNILDGSEKETYKIQADETPYYTIYNKENDTYEFSDMMVSYKKYQHRLNNHIYKNGVSLHNAYNKDHFNVSNKMIKLNDLNQVELELTLNVNFKTLIQEYIRLRDENKNHTLIERYELEYPIFKKAYDQLGAKGISSCKYSEKKINEKLHAFSSKIVNNIISNVYNEIGDGCFISNKELKTKIVENYRLLDIDIQKIGFSVKKIINRSEEFTFTKSQKRGGKNGGHGWKLNKRSFDITTIFNDVA